MLVKMDASAAGGGGITIEKAEVSYPSAYNVNVDTNLKADDGYYYVSFSVNGGYNSLYECSGGVLTGVPSLGSVMSLSVLSNGNIGVSQNYNYGGWDTATIYVYKLT